MPENGEKTMPNIMITGTPGTGKSTLCKELAQQSGMEWLEVSQLAKDLHCLEEFDSEYNCPVLDEDKLLDAMEPMMESGGKIVDYHSCEFFPERWFDIVFVLRTDNTLLYDRLVTRGYTGKKLEDNIQCEIFQTAFEEATNSYDEDIVYELPSNTPANAESNVQRILTWLCHWKQNNT